MKVLGKFLLILGSILFFAAGVLGVISLVNTIRDNLDSMSGELIVSVVLSALLVLVLLFGGLGGIFYAIGAGPFRGWVRPIVIVLTILYIVSLVFTIIAMVKGNVTVKDGLISMIPTGVAEVLYVLGYFLARKRD